MVPRAIPSLGAFLRKRLSSGDAAELARLLLVANPQDAIFREVLAAPRAARTDARGAMAERLRRAAELIEWRASALETPEPTGATRGRSAEERKEQWVRAGEIGLQTEKWLRRGFRLGETWESLLRSIRAVAEVARTAGVHIGSHGLIAAEMFLSTYPEWKSALDDHADKLQAVVDGAVKGRGRRAGAVKLSWDAISLIARLRYDPDLETHQIKERFFELSDQQIARCRKIAQASKPAPPPPPGFAEAFRTLLADLKMTPIPKLSTIRSWRERSR